MISPWNFPEILTILLPRCPSNFKAIRQLSIHISWLWDFTSSGGTMSYYLLQRPWSNISLYRWIWTKQATSFSHKNDCHRCQYNFCLEHNDLMPTSSFISSSYMMLIARKRSTQEMISTSADVKWSAQLLLSPVVSHQLVLHGSFLYFVTL